MTVTFPVFPEPTVAFMVLSDITLKEEALVTPNCTAIVPVKWAPCIVTTVPGPPVTGENEVIVGGGTNVKPVFAPVPWRVVTVTLPEAPYPTVAEMDVGELTKKYWAEESPNLTAETSVKLVPVMVTTVEVPALVGVNDEIVGAWPAAVPTNNINTGNKDLYILKNLLAIEFR